MDQSTYTTKDGKHTVTPPTVDGKPYIVRVLNPEPDARDSFMVDSLKDECSCFALQGISCDHKAAVDEYAEQATAQIIADAQPEPDVQTPPATASHSVKYERRQLGMTDTTPPRPLWTTDVVCSCGFKDASDQPRTKDDAKAVFKQHKQDADKSTPEPIYKSREDWLMAAMTAIHERAALLQLGDNPPPTRVACGFTYGKGARIGECWRKEQSGDGTFEIIVHNKLDNVLEVLAVLVHEIGHTFQARDTQHKAPFQRWSKTMGMVAPWTASLPGPELVEWLTELAAKLGTYPHAALDSAKRIREGGPKKQTNRWLKWTCAHPDCGWIVRTAKPDFKGACISDLHPGQPMPFLPGFTTEAEPE